MNQSDLGAGDDTRRTSSSDPPATNQGVSGDKSHMQQMPLVLTVDEAAELLRISRTATYDAVRRGELLAVRIGRTIRVPRHAVVQLIGLTDSASATGAPSQHAPHGGASQYPNTQPNEAADDDARHPNGDGS